VNRTTLQRLSNERLEDARSLLAAHQWSGAYYLAGYAVECALKSCVLAHIERTGAIFQDKKFAEKCWTHNLEDLVSLSGLKPDRDAAIAASPKVHAYWLTLRDWSEASRYDISTQTGAEDMFLAIEDNADGVLKWLKNYW
jgi:HEPN domain-containing protein